MKGNEMKCFGKFCCVFLVLLMVAAAVATPLIGLYLIEDGPSWISATRETKSWNYGADDWQTTIEHTGTAAVVLSCIVCEIALTMGVFVMVLIVSDD